MTFPLALELSGKQCLVVGGSEEAAHRVRNLLRAGAKVRWVTGSGSPFPTPEVRSPDVDVHQRSWVPEDVDDVWLVVFADPDVETARELRAASDRRRVFFCAIDQTSLNSFNHVAIVEQGPIQIAISSGGRVPALARRLREALQGLLGDGRLAVFAEHLSRLRAESRKEARREAMDRALDGFSIEGRLRLPGESRADE